MIPNMLAHVESCKAKNPDAWKHAHVEGDPRRLEFIKLLAIDVHTANPRFGLNGKRGNPNDISADGLCFKGSGPGHDPTDNENPVTFIDVIQAAGSTDPRNPPRPMWDPYDNPERDGANAASAWVDPMKFAGEVDGNTGSGEATPGRVLEFPPRDLELTAFHALNLRYAKAGRAGLMFGLEEGSALFGRGRQIGQDKATDAEAAEALTTELVNQARHQPVYIDLEGIAVWFGDYLRRYATGDHAVTTSDPKARHEAALAAVLKDITAAGLPETDRRKNNPADLTDQEREELERLEKLAKVEERRGGD